MASFANVPVKIEAIETRRDGLGDVWKHGCGCILRRKVNKVEVSERSKYKKGFEMDEVRWELTDYCKAHFPNYSKKADKVIARNQRVAKRRKFLEERDRRKNGRKK